MDDCLVPWMVHPRGFELVMSLVSNLALAMVTAVEMLTLMVLASGLLMAD